MWGRLDGSDRVSAWEKDGRQVAEGKRTETRIEEILEVIEGERGLGLGIALGLIGEG